MPLTPHSLQTDPQLPNITEDWNEKKWSVLGETFEFCLLCQRALSQVLVQIGGY